MGQKWSVYFVSYILLYKSLVAQVPLCLQRFSHLEKKHQFATLYESMQESGRQFTQGLGQMQHVIINSEEGLVLFCSVAVCLHMLNSMQVLP